jgi:hypothetical protein
LEKFQTEGGDMLTQQALERYHAHKLHWSAKLVSALENVQPSLALDWAIECARSLVIQAAPQDSREKLLRWLDDLSQAKVPAEESNVMEKARSIWYEERNIIGTAISHLYAALAYLLRGDVGWYRTSVIWAMDIMGDHEYYRQTSLAIPLALFERFMSKPN